MCFFGLLNLRLCPAALYLLYSTETRCNFFIWHWFCLPFWKTAYTFRVQKQRCKLKSTTCCPISQPSIIHVEEDGVNRTFKQHWWEIPVPPPSLALTETLDETGSKLNCWDELRVTTQSDKTEARCSITNDMPSHHLHGTNHDIKYSLISWMKAVYKTQHQSSQERCWTDSHSI